MVRFMAEEGLGNPSAEADAQVKALEKYLAENDLAEGVDIYNILVFYNPKVELFVGDSPYPVSNTKGLKKELRKKEGEKLPAALYKQLQDLFDDEWEEVD